MNDVYTTFLFLVAALPYWSRLLQVENLFHAGFLRLMNLILLFVGEHYCLFLNFYRDYKYNLDMFLINE